ncbi:hypothetical protein MBM_07731 [Drepanopeziza brunnea f. sp. 'multigermtubi' MB_m1]|uniref:SHSP domain-containing protein n=1 Tax=Marssonina brunnea f. sp. multigermtubi (strain MB_m1) TaxID=1072389 RepID=K1XNJ1_MARBU|nr:uncharacterized protein MBM_07731 [Drepanopeziza brunnea f. sp. 'multigermtubi' MB_m1]EKD14054.1 hypothetical protein MBM_07731 [Drepanopeziza brunnea f. sp. 'multigermtubi' MB_m1]
MLYDQMLLHVNSELVMDRPICINLVYLTQILDQKLDQKLKKRAMSPFSQLQATLGYGGGIDRNSSPILNYIDEFDHHFPRHHRFRSRDIPDAGVNDSTVEAHDNHTLDKTSRPGPGSERQQQRQQATATAAAHSIPTHHHLLANLPTATTATINPANAANPPSAKPSSSPPPLPRHRLLQHSSPSPNRNLNHNTSSSASSGHRVLLSGRFGGEFTRTFAFPSSVVEEGVQARMENGVLSLVIPKRQMGGERGKRNMGRKVPILRGRWWRDGRQGEGEGEGEGEGKGEGEEGKGGRQAIGRGENGNVPVLV